jgi:5-methyltetrahydropteroyltriglutamate--homocysteine methyltransferase
MEFLLLTHSSYPRVGDKPGQQRLRRAAAERERGDMDAATFTGIERAVIDEIVHEQEEAGLDIITDGQVRWHDPISHIMGALDGVRIDGLLRYFDTNFYFRQPVVTGPVRRRTAILRDDFVHASYAARCRVKPIITGPYTLARLSLIQSGQYASWTALAHALSEVLAAEVADLAGAGASIIQVEEPAILAHPGDIRLLRQLLEPLWAARGAAQLVVATYFGDAEPLYAQLNSLPADILALDFAYSSGLAPLIAATGASKLLAFGVVDGRSTRLEDVHAAAAQIERMLKRYPFETAYLLPSCGLEYLPREKARAKLGLLARIRAAIAGMQ